jgi:hypothetical protein
MLCLQVFHMRWQQMFKHGLCLLLKNGLFWSLSARKFYYFLPDTLFFILFLSFHILFLGMFWFSFSTIENHVLKSVLKMTCFSVNKKQVVENTFFHMFDAYQHIKLRNTFWNSCFSRLFTVKLVNYVELLGEFMRIKHVTL